MAITLLSTADFNNRFGKLVSGKKVLDDELQALIVDALAQAAHPKSGGNGSCNKLDHIVNGLAGQRSWPIRAIRKYIGEHTTAAWSTLKDGRKGYSYNGQPPSVTLPDQTWYEHKASDGNSPAALNIHVASRLQAMIKDSNKEGATVDDKELLDKLQVTYNEHLAAKKAAA